MALTMVGTSLVTMPQPRLENQQQSQGIPTVASQKALLEALDQEKIILLSTPANHITNQILQDLGSTLQAGDIVIDSGNP